MVIPILPRIAKIKASFSLIYVLDTISIINEPLMCDSRGIRCSIYFFYSQLSSVVFINSLQTPSFGYSCAILFILLKTPHTL